MRLLAKLTMAALCAAIADSQAPPPSFELILPDFDNKTIAAGNVVADIPNRPLARLTIQLLGSAEKNLNYGDVRVRINGIGAGNIFNRGSNDRGKFLSMDPALLARRRDPLFDPRENTVEVYGKDPRGRAYYQNWILRVAGANSNPYFTYVSSTSPADERGLPPDLDLDAPTLPIDGRSNIPAVTVKGTASAAAGIATLTFNGVASKEKLHVPSVQFNEAVKLAPNATTLVVEVQDAKGNKRSVTVPVIRPSQAPPPKLSGQNWAVVIGVSQFSAKSNPPPPLPTAAFDAKELAASLQARGFAPDHIRLLTDEHAKVDNIRNALGDFAAKPQPEDFLLVFIATQGLHDPAAPERIYLTASDTQGLKLADTAIEYSELQLMLSRAVRSRHTLFFFDAEHKLPSSWAFQGRPVVNKLLLSLFDGPMGRSVMVSSADDQEGAESAATAAHNARGAFSTALTEALAGKADLDHNRFLTAKEICTYVSQRVREETGGKQSPEFRYPPADAEVPVLALK